MKALTVGVFVLVAIVSATVVAILSALPVSFLVMLLLGLAHSIEPSIPALGFWVTWVLVFILRVATIQNVAPRTVPGKSNLTKRG